MGTSDAGSRIVQFGASRSPQACVALDHRPADIARGYGARVERLAAASLAWAGRASAALRLHAPAARHAAGRSA